MPEKSFDQLILTDTEKTAIHEAERLLKGQFPVEQVILFGSVARGEADGESDTDLLVIAKEKVSHRTRNLMYDLVFEVNFKYLTNISIVVVESDSWKDGILSITPFYEEVQRDGVAII
jgi:predicted nucleotidyltransferase